MSRVVKKLALGVACAFVLAACDTDAGPTDGDASVSASDAGGVAQLDGGVFDVPCTVTPPTTCPDPAPRFADVTPIFKARCAPCHNSEWTGPWPLDTYEHIADWADTVRSHLVECSMPPPEAGTPLPNDESETILAWIRCKAPR